MALDSLDAIGRRLDRADGFDPIAEEEDVVRYAGTNVDVTVDYGADDDPGVTIRQYGPVPDEQRETVAHIRDTYEDAVVDGPALSSPHVQR